MDTIEPPLIIPDESSTDDNQDDMKIGEGVSTDDAAVCTYMLQNCIYDRY